MKANPGGDEEVTYLEITAGFHKRGSGHPAGGYTGAVIGSYGVENPLWRGGDRGDGTEQIGDDEYEDTSVESGTLKAEYDFTGIEGSAGAIRIEVGESPWAGGSGGSPAVKAKLHFANDSGGSGGGDDDGEPGPGPGVTSMGGSASGSHNANIEGNILTQKGDVYDAYAEGETRGRVEKIEMWVEGLEVRKGEDDEGNEIEVGNAGAYMTVKATLDKPMIDRIEWAFADKGEMEGPAFIPWDETVELTAIPNPEKLDFAKGEPEWTLEAQPDDSDLSDEDIEVVENDEDNHTVVTFTPDHPGLYTIKATVDDSEAEIDIYAVQVEVVFAHHLESGDHDGEYEFCQGDSDSGDPDSTTLFVNRADLQEDERPDFASENLEEDTGILKEVVLHICPPDIDWEEEDVDFAFTFAYPGDEELPDFDEAETIGTGPDGTQFKDYISADSGFRDATIRLWAIDDPTESRNEESYVVPDDEIEIGDDDAADWVSDFDGTQSFYVEGISEGSGEISVTLTVNEIEIESDPSAEFEVLEPYLWLNASNDSAEKRPGVPSVDFAEIEEDFIIKDQGEGFVWWETDDDGSGTGRRARIDRNNIVDLIPFKIVLPDHDDDLTVFLEPGIDLVLYPLADGQSGLSFLHTDEGGLAQLDENQIAEMKASEDGHGEEIEKEYLGEEENHFLFHAMETGEEEQMILYLQDPDTEEVVPVDSFRLTIKEVDEFWVFASGRGDDRPYDGDYPTEDGRKAEGMRWFGEPSEVSGHPGSLDTEKSNVLVWIHGFNVTENQARESYAQIFRRLYLLGYRGNFVGFTWEGDSGGLVTGGPMTAIRFDPDVRDAFRSALGFRNYLRGLRDEFGSENIDVVAHSLGNLVMWEAMRLQRTTENSVLIRNMASVQAAIWREAFEERDDLTYVHNSSKYSAFRERDEISYTVDQQQQHSWRFWFNQPDKAIRDVLDGNIYNNFVYESADDGEGVGDSAVQKRMRQNDWVHRARFYQGGLFIYNRWWQYRRDRLENDPKVYRSPTGDARLYNRAPALMDPRRWAPALYAAGNRYRYRRLNYPQGLVANPIADFNFNAFEETEWRRNQHSDYLKTKRGLFSEGQWFPKIYSWWDLFLGEGITVEDKNGLNIIPIGEE
ncbi:MAG: alpha/beta hydrolase [Opitutales bacterium]|nr:alpha/beta hydrolase [Opitutales bacterium]